MRTSFSVFLTVFLALGLVGCRTIWDPSFMGTHYAYHAKEYKAAPGPEASGIGYDYSAASNAEALQVWRVVVQDLVDQVAEQVGATAQGIYIRHLPKTNAFNLSYDHVLREALGERGYVMTANPDGALHLWYEAHVPKYIEDGHDSYVHSDNGDQSDPEYRKIPKHQEFVLILTAVNDGAMAAKAAGVYKLPPYGFVKDASVNPLRVKEMEEKGQL